MLLIEYFLNDDTLKQTDIETDRRTDALTDKQTNYLIARQLER